MPIKNKYNIAIIHNHNDLKILFRDIKYLKFDNVKQDLKDTLYKI